jgi:hypothetical protein
MKVYVNVDTNFMTDSCEYQKRIVNFLQRNDYRVLNASTKSHGNSSLLISECDVAVFEISYPTTINIGFELSRALSKKKPTIALYHEQKQVLYFNDVKDEKLFLSDYHDFDLEEVLAEGLRYAVTQTETRYNLYLSSKHLNYLDEVVKSTRLTRASYIRKLIEEDMNC